MNTFIIRAVTFCFFIMLFACVENKIEIQNSISLEVDNNLTNDLAPVLQAVPYLCYAIPTNFWYPSGTTSQEIIDDDFDHGLNGLTELESLVESMNGSFSISVKENRDSLLFYIRKHKKQILHIKEVKNSLLGMLMFSYADIMGSMSESNDNNSEFSMPKDIVNSMSNLKTALYIYLNKLVKEKFIEIEKKCMTNNGNPILTEDERRAIQEHLLAHATKRLIKSATTKDDSLCIDVVFNNIVNFLPDTNIEEKRKNTTKAPDRSDTEISIQIRATIDSYYELSKTGSFDELKQLYANPIERFFSLENTSPEEVIKDQKRFATKFSLLNYEIDFTTLEISSNSERNIFEITYNIPFRI
ncbi:MAG TPA: hypothetical protein PLM70_10005, partial [Bacteroidales bacterium]|nr:hypothetical protein [Bacteroidales bacterium]